MEGSELWDWSWLSHVIRDIMPVAKEVLVQIVKWLVPNWVLLSPQEPKMSVTIGGRIGATT